MGRKRRRIPKNLANDNVDQTRVTPADAFLLANYGTFPGSAAEMKVGHVMYSYQAFKSGYETAKKLQEEFPEYAITDLVCLSLKISRLSRQESTHRLKLDIEKYSTFCSLAFDISRLSKKPETEAIDIAETECEPQPGPSQVSPVKTTRSAKKCGSCKKKTRSLQLIKNKTSKLQKALREAPRSDRSYRLKLARRNLTIDRLKKKLRDNANHVEIAAARHQNQRLKQYNSKIKRAWKKRRAALVAQHREEKKMLERDMRNKSKKAGKCIAALENEHLALTDDSHSVEQTLKLKSARYNDAARMMVYSCLVNNVPTENIPVILTQMASHLGFTIEQAPHRSTIEHMMRELGAISELQVAELLFTTENVTIGFDATTQEHIHVNEVHFSSADKCLCASIEQLPGAKSVDYANHIKSTIDSLARVYCHFKGGEFEEIRSTMIHHISNSLTDRCITNKATINALEKTWDIVILQLKCHLHPLDAMATSVRSVLKKNCAPPVTVHKLFGTDCSAANVILALHKMRFKPSKGDPAGFVSLLQEHDLPLTLFPRYRGNRLHILFHTSGVVVCHHELLISFFKCGVSCGGLRPALLENLSDSTVMTQLVILGLLGKLLTGPWMKKLYTAKNASLHHLEVIPLVRIVIVNIDQAALSPLTLRQRTTDFFGDPLDNADLVIISLQKHPVDPSFAELMIESLNAISTVLKRQYDTYLKLNITPELMEQTRSAEVHNMASESIMGMFSAAKSRAPRATMCFTSCQIRSKKSDAVGYLNECDALARADIIARAMPLGRRQRGLRRFVQRCVVDEIARRIHEKMQKKADQSSKDLEKKLEKCPSNQLDSLIKELSSHQEDVDVVHDLLNGFCAGRRIEHIWNENGVNVHYSGRLLEHVTTKETGRGKNKKNVTVSEYDVAYWKQDESEAIANDWDMSAYALAADFMLGDLFFIEDDSF